MPGLVPGIHVFAADVDGRDEPGRDAENGSMIEERDA
jgi:hypothetical protein